MSINNICFLGEVRKISVFFSVEKVPHLELLSVV